MPAFRRDRPNVVVFGDSNTWVFGPALRDWLVANASIPASQVAIKYKSGSRPRDWLPGATKALWTSAERFPTGPSVQSALSGGTELVVIGLGGNMIASQRAAVVSLIEAVTHRAPKARILWRGPPPATARKDGTLATLEQKLKRYMLNRAVKRELEALGFDVLDAESRGDEWGARKRRVYLDLISLHACGPSKQNPSTVGGASDLQLERDVLASAVDSLDVQGEHPVIGPWNEFVRARDNMSVPTHVPRAAADAFYQRHVGPTGVLEPDSAASPPAGRPTAESRWRVIDGDARIRNGPPGFRWRRPRRIPVGTLVRIVEERDEYARVVGIDGSDFEWTVKSNLRREPDVPAPTVIPAIVRTAEPDVYTVVDKRALLRSGPPGFASTGASIPRSTRVFVERTDGVNAFVRKEGGDELGWTRSSNLHLYQKDVGRLRAVSLAPPQTVSGTTPTQRKLAAVYNRLGGLMDQLAADLRIETAAVLAVWMAESGGRIQNTGQMTIRFENHVFFSRWGKRNPATYDRHFRHGGRKGVSGKAHRNHRFRAGASGSFRTFHGNQSLEYEVLELAARLSNARTARACISMGGAQIMGFNHRRIGYASTVAMYDAFQADERNHVLGFFDFCQTAMRNDGLIRLLREHEWTAFGESYNGSSTYGDKIRRFHASAAAILP